MDCQSIRQNLAGKCHCQWKMSYTGDRIITSRANDGVKDGSASKIGVVSWEAMLFQGVPGYQRNCWKPQLRSCRRAASIGFRPIERLASDGRPRVQSPVRTVLFLTLTRLCRLTERIRRVRLTTVTLLQNVRPTVGPKERCRCLLGSFETSAAPPFDYCLSPSRDTPTQPLAKAVPV